MAPRKTRAQVAVANNAAGSVPTAAPQKAAPQFPPISPKRRLQTRVLLEDQILLVDVCPVMQLRIMLSIERSTRVS